MSDFIVFDVETPNGYNDRICSIGISRIEDETLISNQNFLINPECHFDRRAIAIHGITEEQVQNAPTFPEVWQSVRNDFFSSIVVAHNARFDLTVLNKTLSHYGITEDRVSFVDTLSLFKHYYPELPSYKLNSLCEEFEIDIVHHDSGSDSAATAQLVCKLLNEGKDISKFVSSYDLDESVPVSRHHHLSVASEDLADLVSLLSVIIDDGIIEASEIIELITWLNLHDELLDTYPYSAIYDKLYEILEDSIISDAELKELFALFSQLINPVSNTDCHCENICLTGKTICLSGEFSYGSKEKVSILLQSEGAIMVKTVSKKTDFVLVGEKGNSEWITGNYGTKIKKAMELQAKGCGIKIIREEDLISGKKE